MHGWQANPKRTCAQPVVLGLCPKLKYPPLYGGIFILNTAKKIASKELGLSIKDCIVITGGDVWTPSVRENDRRCAFFF